MTVSASPCESCGHTHEVSQQCADHQWTDVCPYDGLECPTPEQRAVAANAVIPRELGTQPDPRDETTFWGIVGDNYGLYGVLPPLGPDEESSS